MPDFLAWQPPAAAPTVACWSSWRTPGRDDCRAYFHLSGCDPQLERVSPGMLLVRQAVEAVTVKGMAHAAFLRGRGTYKYFWGVEDCPTFRRLAIRGGG
ncbi:GNAT family N-acetyltransferase [Belnapia rosea]|nr:GNAT family N-acetyltransferase [Belnapia rosea]